MNQELYNKLSSYYEEFKSICNPSHIRTIIDCEERANELLRKDSKTPEEHEFLFTVVAARYGGECKFRLIGHGQRIGDYCECLFFHCPCVCNKECCEKHKDEPPYKSKLVFCENDSGETCLEVLDDDTQEYYTPEEILEIETIKAKNKEREQIKELGEQHGVKFESTNLDDLDKEIDEKAKAAENINNVLKQSIMMNLFNRFK